jgi:preprotein translocase subunit YajC
LNLAKSPSVSKSQAEAMPRVAVLIIIIVLIIGALYFLSTVPKQQPTKTVEVEVPQTNAH